MEHCTLFVQFETELPSNSVICSLHSGITNVSRPKWARKRKGCCVEFETPELAAEALNEIEEMEMEGGPVKVDFLYNVTNKETHSKRYSEAVVMESQSNENGGGAEEEEEEEEEIETGAADGVPAFEVDPDVLKEQGVKSKNLKQGSHNGKENGKVKQDEDKNVLKPRSSDPKDILNRLEIETDIKKFALFFLSGFEPKLESTGRKGVKETGNLKAEKDNTKKQQDRNEKEKQRFPDQKAGSRSTAVRSWKKANDLEETSSEQGKKTKGVMQTCDQKKIESTEVRRKKEKRSIESFPDLSAKTESKKIKKDKKINSLKGRFSGQKWEIKNIESERIKMKRKHENVSAFVVVDKKMKIPENKGNKKLNRGNVGENNMKKIEKNRWTHNWIVRDAYGQDSIE